MKALAVRSQLMGLIAKSVLYSAGFLLSLSTVGCLNLEQGSEDGTTVVSDPSDPPPPFTAPEQTICDPFNVGNSTRDRGIIGNLVYLTDDMPRYTQAVDYIANGLPIPSTLYFDKLYVPTRAFDMGFFTQDGRLVTNQDGNTLYEYFGLRLESQLQLAEGEAPGWYELSMLSDDGANLYVKNADGSLDRIVNNDGTHPTRMGCGSKAIYMDGTNKVPIVIDYYQGPRFHISLVVMWRPLPDGADPSAPAVDVECGRSGNSRYFNSNVVPSAPSATFYDLLTRGWKPLENANYYFPEQASNPCGAEDPLLISNFVIAGVTKTSVTLSWTTNMPSTSMAEIKNVATGVITQTPEDTTLKTSHSVTITGLTANTLYAVKGISSVPANQTVTSEERAFRTAR